MIYFYNNGIFEHEGDFDKAFDAFQEVWDKYGEEEDLVDAIVEAERRGCYAITTGMGRYELSWR